MVAIAIAIAVVGDRLVVVVAAVVAVVVAAAAAVKPVVVVCVALAASAFGGLEFIVVIVIVVVVVIPPSSLRIVDGGIADAPVRRPLSFPSSSSRTPSVEMNLHRLYHDDACGSEGTEGPDPRFGRSRWSL